MALSAGAGFGPFDFGPRLFPSAGFEAGEGFDSPSFFGGGFRFLLRLFPPNFFEGLGGGAEESPALLLLLEEEAAAAPDSGLLEELSGFEDAASPLGFAGLLFWLLLLLSFFPSFTFPRFLGFPLRWLGPLEGFGPCFLAGELLEVLEEEEELLVFGLDEEED